MQLIDPCEKGRRPFGIDVPRIKVAHGQWIGRRRCSSWAPKSYPDGFWAEMLYHTTLGDEMNSCGYYLVDVGACHAPPSCSMTQSRDGTIALLVRLRIKFPTGWQIGRSGWCFRACPRSTLGGISV